MLFGIWHLSCDHFGPYWSMSMQRFRAEGSKLAYVPHIWGTDIQPVCNMGVLKGFYMWRLDR